MNRIALSIGVAAMLAVGAAQAQQTESRMAKIAGCEGAKADQLIAMVKNDFLQNRLPRWADDKKLLGTSTPVVWVQQDQVVQNGDDWQIPLTVRGTKVDRNYTVKIDCKAGDLAYSQPQ